MLQRKRISRPAETGLQIECDGLLQDTRHTTLLRCARAITVTVPRGLGLGWCRSRTLICCNDVFVHLLLARTGEEPAWGSTERSAGWAFSTTDRISRMRRTITTTSGSLAGFASPSCIASWRSTSACASRGLLVRSSLIQY